MYPEGISKLAECNDAEEVQRVVEYYPVAYDFINAS
jgi:hypothetical protein